MIAAYVEGLPIPNFSNSFTKDASVNLLIGFVKCCFDSKEINLRLSPSFISGKINSVSSLSFLFSVDISWMAFLNTVGFSSIDYIL